MYVGNLPWATDDQALGDLFAQFGQVNSATVLRYKFTGKSRGFGFVEMENDDEAKEAISKLHGTDLEGRKIIVNEAFPPKERNDQDSSEQTPENNTSNEDTVEENVEDIETSEDNTQEEETSSEQSAQEEEKAPETEEEQPS